MAESKEAVFSIYDKEYAPDIRSAIVSRFPRVETKETVEGMSGSLRAFVVRGSISLEELNGICESIEKDIDYPCSRFHPGDSHPDIPW